MKKTLLSFSLFALLSGTLSAQITDEKTEKALRTQAPADSVFGWKFSGLASLNAANTLLVNWVAGGENSLGFESNAMIFANLRKPKFVWENSLNVAYGTMRQGDNTKKFLKTNDRLEFNSKYGQKAYKDFYYSALANFQTQMFDGKNYTSDTTYDIISRFFAPASLLAAIGMDYNPNANLSLFISPLSARFTFVEDKALSDAGAFGVTPGEHFLDEYGGYARFMFKKSTWNWEIMKNVVFVTKLNVFFNYNLPNEDNPLLDRVKQNVKANWENQLLFNINKYLTFMFSNQYIYDRTTEILDKKGRMNPNQYKQITSLGIAYKF